jgi:fatty acid desaturase
LSISPQWRVEWAQSNALAAKLLLLLMLLVVFLLLLVWFPIPLVAFVIMTHHFNGSSPLQFTYRHKREREREREREHSARQAVQSSSV